MEIKSKETELVEKVKKEGTLEKLKLSDIIPYPNNAKIHTEEQVSAIRDSIINFGYIDYISVDENNQILAGHGRLKAFNQIDSTGLKVINVLKITHLTEPEKKAFRIAHNKLSLMTDFDSEILKSEFDSLEGSEYLDSTGFDFGEISNLDKVNSADDEWIGMPDFDSKDDSYKIIVHFENEADRDKFNEEYEFEFMKKQEKAWSMWWPNKKQDDLKSLKYEA